MYHSAVHASTSYGMPHEAAIPWSPRFVESPIRHAMRLRLSCGERVGDGPGDGGGDDPGGLRAVDVFALEGEAAKPVPVDMPVRCLLDAQASALEVLDYWREGVIPTVHYSPISLAPTDDTEHVTRGALGSTRGGRIPGDESTRCATSREFP
ncbi:hypothetical protein M2271_008203 [Streptomyces sp. LBL]|nr:hypothetical protein [Streptomyces sp. LBL]